MTLSSWESYAVLCITERSRLIDVSQDDLTDVHLSVSRIQLHVQPSQLLLPAGRTWNAPPGPESGRWEILSGSFGPAPPFLQQKIWSKNHGKLPVRNF